jgi:hypothetical protein
MTVTTAYLGSVHSYSTSHNGHINRQPQVRETAEFIKSHYTIYDLWEMFHLDGNPRKNSGFVMDAAWEHEFFYFCRWAGD